MDQQQCTGLYDIHVEAFGVGRDTGICGSQVYLELCKNLYYNTRKASVCLSVCMSVCVCVYVPKLLPGR